MTNPAIVSFDEFWQWLQGHPNCILSAGSSDVALYDADDIFWHLTREADEALLVQVVRGKLLVAEMALPRGIITHVQMEQRGEEEFLFECFVDSEEGALPAYFFTMSHDMQQEEDPRQRRWIQ